MIQQNTMHHDLRTLGWSDDLDLHHYSLSAGDLNADGFVDVVIGSPDSDVDRFDDTDVVHLSEAGKVRVFFGSAKGLAEEAAITYEGDQAFGHFGHSVQVVGDVNGNGIADLVAGAPDQHDKDPEAGRTYLYLGSDAGPSRYPDRVLSGDSANGRFGASVSTAGDVNNDGLADVVIGAPQRPDPAGGTGAAWSMVARPGGLPRRWPVPLGGHTPLPVCIP